ncbi:hypothetical protein CHLNCDRAFT_138347 [Chlorella variabilis]|uniref:tRNA/rRNA methyltransferase SpoU type domain-containing protein n=1 Tax=Chlorella variabilis TaxID=554065 RepID=E1ZMU7_CHLVA|nr:hypothetical protein CHLNCDRAFT_138347 [Chlorella variabilis]EFN52863.1 hypothetical protein CHLNCDRAFT_138347 [Chlorella variabilis]|eukprot:XP_005844965.1 hypothetical protein CHLNCDRAFT_138347 [Chlorella variabilis]
MSPGRLDGVERAIRAVAPPCLGLDLVAAGQLAAAALAVVTQALPPGQQLAAVLRLAPEHSAGQMLDAEAAQLLWPLAAAAVVLLRQAATQQAANGLQCGLERDSACTHAAAAITQLLLPMMASDLHAASGTPASAEVLPPASAAASVRQQELLRAVAELVAACGGWDLGMALVQAAIAGEQQQPDPGIQQADRVLASGAAAARVLPPGLRMQLAAAVVQQALRAAEGQQQTQSEQPTAVDEQMQQGPCAILRHAARHTLPEVLAHLLAKPHRQLHAQTRQRRQEQQAAEGRLTRAAAQHLLPATLAAAAQQGEEAAAVQLLQDACLCDGEAANRKRAAHVLAFAVQQQEAHGQLAPAWQSFFKLLDCLDERAPHLDGWAEIDRLSPAAASPDAAGTTPGSGLAWPWMAVQRLVLESFLGWRWHVEGQGAEAAAGQPSLLADVPTPFVLEVLLPAAGQAHMWRGEGAAALQQQVSAWVGRYSAAALGQEQQRQLLIALLDQLGGAAGGSQQKQQQVLRPLAQTVAAALVASSQAVAAATAAARPTDGSSSEERQAHEWRLLFLQRLQRATASLSSSWGSEGASSAYAADMCSSLVQAAAAAVPLSDIRGDDDSSGSGSRTLLLAIGTWLSQLPLPLLLPGGALHLPAAHWLQAGGQQQRLATLASCVRDYLAAAAAPDAAPRDGWEVQAGGLAQPYLPRGTAERCLLLLSQLLAICSPLASGAATTTQQQQQQQLERMPERHRQQLPSQYPLVHCLAATLCCIADELASYSSMLAAALLWSPMEQQELGGSTGQQDSRPALLSLRCMSSSLGMLLSWRRQQVTGAADAAVGQLARALEGHQQQQSLAGAAAEAASAALGSVLSLQAAAAAATIAAPAVPAPGGKHQAAAAATSSSDAAAAAFCHRLCWKAAVGLLGVCQQLAAEQPQDAYQQQRWEEQQGSLLAVALRSLEAEAGITGPAADPRRLLLQLRCCRLLLPAALEQPRVLHLALSYRQPRDLTASGGGSSEGMAALVGWLCSAAWRAYEGTATGSRRRRTGLTAALVATCLHPALFDASADPARRELHAAGAPLQQLVLRLLDAGSRSWRSMSTVSLQLCGLLTRHAELATQYSATLQQLLLWGSAEDPGQSGEGDAVDGETAAELAALIAPGDAHLAEAFEATKLAPRVAALCMLWSWVQQAEAEARASTIASAAPAREAGLLLWGQLLDLSASDPELSAARCTDLGKVHRKKVRLWQALCVLSPLVPAEQADQDFEAVLGALSRADMANVKQYQDACASVLLHRRPALLRSHVLPALRDCCSSASFALSSLILIAARAAAAELRPEGSAAGQAQPGESQGALLAEVVGSITPWSLSHVHALRENEDVNRLRRGLSQAFYFDSFDLAQAVTPAGILCKAGAPLLEEVQSFLSVERQLLRQDLRQGKVATATAELAGAWAAALGTPALLGGSLDGAELELAAAEEATSGSRSGPRQELLVVASLLTKAPNLAGLARTCEVFRASGLVLPGLAVTRLPEFKSIAVSAHLWLPLIEVPEAMLAAWLQRQAAQGWTLVGLEQSTESVQLQDFRFPRRTVLVLGREKEGIPSALLGLLDHSVEIPQLGARSSRALLADEAVEAAPAPGLAEAPFVAPAEAPGPSVALSVGSGAALYERPDRCEKLGTMCQLVETTFDRRKGEELEINVFQNKCCDGRQCTYKKEYLRNGAKVKEWECT